MSPPNRAPGPVWRLTHQHAVACAAATVMAVPLKARGSGPSGAQPVGVIKRVTNEAVQSVGTTVRMVIRCARVSTNGQDASQVRTQHERGAGSAPP